MAGVPKGVVGMNINNEHGINNATYVMTSVANYCKWNNNLYC